MTLPLPAVSILKRLIPCSRSVWWGLLASLVGGTALATVGLSTGAKAAETVTVSLGSLSQTVALSDLETFASSGEVPSSLQIYRSLLSPSLRQTLQSTIEIEPEMGHIVLDELLNTPGGTQLLDTLQAVAPNVSPSDLRVMLDELSAQEGQLTLVSMLRALPQETLQINLGTLGLLASQFRLAQMESEALSRVLETELQVDAPSLGVIHAEDPFSQGSAAVERWELVLRDRSRERSIPVDIYWSEETHGPLVVISHGFGADRRFFAYLAQHLASHGLTVVSVEHPGSNVAALMSLPTQTEEIDKPPSRILPATEFLDRPRDISFVLDRMEKLNYYSYSLRDRMNTDQVTLIGHSLGGNTALALAGAELDLRPLSRFCQQLSPVNFSPADWLQCAALDLPVNRADLKDDRVSQVIVMNPLTGLLFGEQGLRQIDIPTLMFASTHDGVTPVAEQQLNPFNELAGQKYLVTMIGASHLSVGDPENLNSELGQIPFMPALPDEKTGRLRSFLQGVSLSFIMQQTPRADDYRNALTPNYAQLYSTPDLPLRLTQELPESLTHWPRLQADSLHHQEKLRTYLPSLLHLEAIAIQDQFQALQRQMVAYLRSSPPSLTAIYLPRSLFRPPIQAKNSSQK
jgi:predicted dienelactone hydrolase